MQTNLFLIRVHCMVRKKKTVETSELERPRYMQIDIQRFLVKNSKYDSSLYRYQYIVSLKGISLYRLSQISDPTSDNSHFQKNSLGEFLQPLKKYTIMKEIATKNRRQHKEYYTLSTSLMSLTRGVLSGVTNAKV